MVTVKIMENEKGNSVDGLWCIAYKVYMHIYYTEKGIECGEWSEVRGEWSMMN